MQQDLPGQQGQQVQQELAVLPDQLGLPVSLAQAAQLDLLDRQVQWVQQALPALPVL